MTERPIACAEVQKYGDVVRRVGSDVELVKLMALETPASARCTRAEQLRSLMAMISGDGFDVFDTLDEELKRKRVPLDSMGTSPGSKETPFKLRGAAASHVHRRVRWRYDCPP